MEKSIRKNQMRSSLKRVPAGGDARRLVNDNKKKERKGEMGSREKNGYVPEAYGITLT